MGSDQKNKEPQQISTSGNLFSNPIEFLIAQCPESAELRKLDAKSSRRRTLQNKIKQYRIELEQKTKDEIDELCVKVSRESRYIIDESLPFLSALYNADFEKWGALASWTIDEAGALLIGKDPDTFQWEEVARFKHTSRACETAYNFRRAASRVAEQKKWKACVPPTQLVRWATSRGFIFPENLTLVVESYADKPRDDGERVDSEDLKPRQIKNLLKLVIAMAVTRYHYDPTKLGCRGPSVMKEDVESLGIKGLGTDGITSLLHIAAEEIDPADIREYLKENKTLKAPTLRAAHRR